MSKQSDAKLAQGYEPKATPNTCTNCKHLTKNVVDREYNSWNGKIVWTEDKNLRCSIGGFAVKKMGRCNAFSK